MGRKRILELIGVLSPHGPKPVQGLDGDNYHASLVDPIEEVKLDAYFRAQG